MKRVFLLIVVPALLVALGFAQTPATSIVTDQTNIKGCLGGSDGYYTVVEDNTGHILKITVSTVDLKPHMGHDVTLIGHRASGSSSAAADNSFAVTELNMISEHCAAAAAAAAPTVSTPPETAVTPATAATAPVASTSTIPETSVTPAPPAAAPATAVTPAETVVTPPLPAAAPVAPITPAEAAITPPPPAAAPTVAVTPAETVVTSASEPVLPKRLPARSRRLSPAPAAAAITPVETASKSSEPVSTGDAGATKSAAPASTSSEPVSTPAAAAATTPAPARRGSFWLLILLGVVVIVVGTMAPLFSRWRKRKALEQTDAPNLSFTREANPEQDKSDQPGPRKAA
jgi:hypothetical protein